MNEEPRRRPEEERLNAIFAQLTRFVDEANQLQHSLYTAIPWFVCWDCERLKLDADPTYLAVSPHDDVAKRPFCQRCILYCNACQAWYCAYTHDAHVGGACAQ